jgi:hypothetical protein
MSDTTKSGDEQPPVALVPVEQRDVDFYGDKLTATLVNTDEGLQVYVPLRPICNYLGLDWSAQSRRIQRDEILRESQGVVIMATPGSGGGRQEMTCLPLDILPGWLFGVDAARVKPELRDKIKRYQKYCFRILSQAFQEAAMTMPDASEITTPAPAPVGVPRNLFQIRDLGLAVFQLAEQQIIFEQEQIASKQEQMILRQDLTANELATEAAGQLAASAHQRLDRAADVVREIRQRLNIVEARTAPTTVISNEQASQIALAVKALAEQLSRANPQGPNQYQGVYIELYRRFGVSSYKRIRRSQFEDVLNFLENWRSTGSTPPAAPGD